MPLRVFHRNKKWYSIWFAENTSVFLVVQANPVRLSSSGVNVWSYAFLTHKTSVYGQTNFLFDTPLAKQKGEHQISLAINGWSYRTLTLVNVWPYALKTHMSSVYGQTDFLFDLSNTK